MGLTFVLIHLSLWKLPKTSVGGGFNVSNVCHGRSNRAGLWEINCECKLLLFLPNMFHKAIPPLSKYHSIINISKSFNQINSFLSPSSS